MKITTITETYYDFEPGDLFVFRSPAGCYHAGDFLRLRKRGFLLQHWELDTRDTVLAKAKAATCDDKYLSDLLAAEVIVHVPHAVESVPARPSASDQRLDVPCRPCNGKGKVYVGSWIQCGHCKGEGVR